MCGIVGLLVKNPAMRGRLGELMVPMLEEMASRGPESAGLAVFTDRLPETDRKYSLYAPAWDYDWAPFEADFIKRFGTEAQMAVKGNHAVLTCDEPADAVKAWTRQNYPALHVLSAGRRIDIYKDIGHPADIAKRYDFPKLTGTHVVGHTRMATESAVTPDRAHPFTAGEDFCLVHNGTISNPFMVRRKLEHRGIRFETDNDTEAATRFLEWRTREGDTLEQALRKGFEELDGFYTFLIGTDNQLALVRDAFACKPAIVAETDDYVAISSEFRGLAHLPGVNDAKLFEPMPEELYVWTV
ncbi:MAG: amidophosphoribosyltransferase [Burkholderiales bacterium]|jgi:glutamate synthase domain-containing protein 1|nr:amidophosphoribosyltransferase [Burkholderiales bacterium]